MTFTIVSVSTASEVITIRHRLSIKIDDGGNKYPEILMEEEVIIEEIHTENAIGGAPFMSVIWEWFIPPSDEFIAAMARESVGKKIITRGKLLYKCRDEIVRQSRRGA